MRWTVRFGMNRHQMSRHRAGSRRGAAVVAAAALVGALLSAAPVLAAPDSSAAAPPPCPSQQFWDVPAAAQFCPDIQWLASTGVTQGYPDPGRTLPGFHPTATVTRQVMAAFLHRYGFQRQPDPQCTGPIRLFDDVPDSGFCGSVEWLAGTGITGGYPDGGFHPADPVTRQSMAAFLYRFAHHGTDAGACTAPSRFSDVAQGSGFCGDITWLAGTGITGGYPDGGFHPAAPVTRQTMAAFLHRADAGGAIPLGHAVPLPTVTAVAPGGDGTLGGATVHIAGEGLTGATAVTFDRSPATTPTAATGVHVDSDTRLTVTDPAHAAGQVTVRVTTPAGTSVPSAASVFGYLAGAVSAASATGAGSTSLTLQWTNPPDPAFTGVTIRRATGTTPPSGPADGTAVTDTVAGAAAYTDTGLTPGTTYSYALFARGEAQDPAPAATVTAATSAPLAISTTALPPGTAGLRYQQDLAATGGTAPYSWSVTGLPAGLSADPTGIISGSPTAVGTSPLSVAVTDNAGATATVALTLDVPTTVPAACVAQACSIVTPEGSTVQVPAGDIVAVGRDTAGRIDAVTLTGLSVTAEQVLVLAPTAAVPSGAIVGVDSAVAGPGGTVTAMVHPVGPAAAYASGTVQALADPTGAPAPPSTADAGPPGPRAPGAPAAPAAVDATKGAVLQCDSGAIATLGGLTVTPTFTPTLAAIWKHPLFGGGGIYVGDGGLSLFQFDLDGSITLAMSAQVSGAATCTLTPPGLHRVIPAGDLGAVLLDLDPSLTLHVTGKVDISTSVTLKCGAEYRWSNGSESRVHYCRSTHQPLQLGPDDGIDATAAATLDASITLDDVVGITGSITAGLHAGYHPARHPVAEIDASAGYQLGACLACFWSGSPAQVTLVSGTIFDKTLATWDTAPPATAPVIATGALPFGSVAAAYTAALATTDHRAGTWAVTAGTLPPGLSLTGDTIAGTPTTAGTSRFSLRFTDAANRSGTTSLTITVAAQQDPPNPPGVWSWGDGDVGQLGDGSTATGAGPVRAQGPSGIVAISSGAGRNTYAIRADGTVWAWGLGTHGELGNGTFANSATPVPVQGLSGVTAIAPPTNPNGGTVYALRGDGTVWAWGLGTRGELGNGTVANSAIPVQVQGLTGIVSVVARCDNESAAPAYAIRSDGTVWAWGANGYGQLGDGSTTDRAVPTQVVGLGGVTAIATNGYTTLALLGDGTVRSWGSNSSGVLGDGDGASAPYSAVPVPVSGLTGITAVAVGGSTAYALRGDGTVWAWGYGSYGEIGDGRSRQTQDTPVQIPTLTGVTAIAASSNAYALRTDGTVWAWGSGDYGSLGNGVSASSATPVPVSGLTGVSSVITYGSDAYALRTDGTVRAWGSGAVGALGNGATADSDVPLVVPGLTGVTAITGGYGGAAALVGG